MRNILITEEQFRTLLKEYSIDDQVHFGEPVAINAYQVHMPVEIDGKEYTIDEINFIIEPKKVQGVQLYQPHIFIAPELQKHGFCYRIFRAFIREYGNLYNRAYVVVDRTGSINKIFQRLGQEPDINVIYDEDMQGKYLIAYLDDSQSLNEDIDEKMSGIDSRLSKLAEQIYNNALQAIRFGISPKEISAEQINNAQDYFHATSPLYIEINFDMNDDTYAMYEYDIVEKKSIMHVNPRLFGNMSQYIPTIMHELTHMANILSTKGLNAFYYPEVSNKDVNNFFYLFNPTEIQARLSEYYYDCKRNTCLPLANNDILMLEVCYSFLQKLSNNKDFAKMIYTVLKYRQNKKYILLKHFTDSLNHNTSPYGALIKYYTKIFKKYCHKAEKIYKYFSEQNNKKTSYSS